MTVESELLLKRNPILPMCPMYSGFRERSVRSFAEHPKKSLRTTEQTAIRSDSQCLLES